MKIIMKMFSGEKKGCGTHKMFPRVLLGLPAHALRDAATQVPQVQRRIRRQRLPPTVSIHLETRNATGRTN